jgi:hypothetical protein
MRHIGTIAAAIKKFVAAAAVTADAYWSQVLLSLRMESSDPFFNQVTVGSHFENNVTDVKGGTITNTGVTFSAVTYKVGTYSAYFAGNSAATHLSLPSGSCSFGTNDFTLEFWINVSTPALPNGGYVFIMSSSLRNSGSGFYMNVAGDGTGWAGLGTIGFSGATTLANGPSLTSATVIRGTGWHHIAIARAGVTTRMFIDGILEATHTAADVANYSSTNTYLGRSYGIATDSDRFYLDDFRVTNGAARYTTNFCPPTTAFPEPTNVAIDDTGRTVTTVGNARYSGVSKYALGSFYFDGNGAYLTIPDSDDFHLGNNDFTVEAWVRMTAYATLNAASYVVMIAAQDLSTSRSWSFQIEGTATSFTTLNFTGFADNGSNYTAVSAGYAFALNTWYHVAASRIGDLVYLHINGVCVNPGGTAFSRTIQNSTTTVKIGALEYDATYHYYFTGYIDDLRITRGVGRYKTDFTPAAIVASAPTGDPYFNYTTLLLKMDGSFVDTSYYSPKTVTANGNAAVSAVRTRYGSASGYFDGTGDYLTVTTGSEFDFGTGDFTIECWIFPTVIGTQIKFILGKSASWSSNIDFALRINIDGKVLFIGGDAAAIGVQSDAAVSINAWYNVAVCRRAGVTTLFINGIAQSTPSSVVATIPNDATTLYIGSYATAGSEMYYGYLDDLRITKGVARYVGNFTPPGPHQAFAATDTDQWWFDTVLAVRHDGASGATALIDLKGKTISNTMPIALEQSKFGQAAYCNGSTSASVPTSTDFDFGTGLFTIECWFYLTANSGAAQYPSLIGRSSGAGNLTQWILGFNPSGAGLKFNVMQSSGTWLDPGPNYTGTLTVGKWYHLALVRVGTGATDIKLFLDGVIVASSTSNPNTEINNVSKPVFWLVEQGGYIDDLRITKGIARYTTTFTPSELPLPTYAPGPAHDPHWSKVILAAPFDTSAYCARGKTITLSGAVIGTGKKFGSGSLYLDGVDDYGTTTDYDDLDLGVISASTNWTFECWIRPTDATTGGMIASHARPGSGNSGRGGWAIYIASGKVRVDFAKNSSGASNLFCFNTTNAAPIASATWSHIAVVLENGLLKIFVDGVLMPHTPTLTNGFYQSTPIGLDTAKLDWGVELGRYPADSGAVATFYYAGYVDDLRITKDVARYTTCFALPTEANVLG